MRKCLPWDLLTAFSKASEHPRQEFRPRLQSQCDSKSHVLTKGPLRPWAPGGLHVLRLSPTVTRQQSDAPNRRPDSHARLRRACRAGRDQDSVFKQSASACRPEHWVLRPPHGCAGQAEQTLGQSSSCCGLSCLPCTFPPREQRCWCQVCQSVYFSLLTLVFNFLMKNANKCTVNCNKHFLVVFWFMQEKKIFFFFTCLDSKLAGSGRSWEKILIPDGRVLTINFFF